MRKPLFAFLLLTFCLIAVAKGQGTTSRVTGTVHDANGAAIAGATVTLTNEATAVSFTAQTSDSGTYSFDLVQIGKYTVAIEKQGFKKFVSQGNPVNVNTPANAVVLPTGWTLTNSSIPATVSTMPDGRVRLDFINPRPDEIQVLITARRRAAP